MKAYLTGILILVVFVVSKPVMAESLPSQPDSSEHPGSSSYSFTVFRQKMNISGREVEAFCPKEVAQANVKAPVIIFGHGQALDIQSYNLTFDHLAKKGICVIFPTYDTGFFDQEWRRMASDYVSLSAMALRQLSSYADPSKVIFAGHSKGAYVALVAAGLPEDKLLVKPASLVIFAPAGFDSEWIANVNKSMPVSIIFGESDTIIKRDLVSEIFQKLPSVYKQFILVKGYTTTSPQLPADHFFILNKKSFFGGRNGVSSLHFYGVWKWLGGAASDVSSGGNLKDSYLYGSEASSTGLPGLNHDIMRTW